jgi:hypothetical protein
MVEHSRPRLHSSRWWLGSLLAQVFLNAQFMLIHVAIRSTLFYSSPRFLGKDTSRVYWGHQTLLNFRGGAARARLRPYELHST